MSTLTTPSLLNFDEWSMSTFHRPGLDGLKFGVRKGSCGVSLSCSLVQNYKKETLGTGGSVS